MNTLIGNEVRTAYSNYAFGSREEAEAFYFAARDRITGRAPGRKVEEATPSPQPCTLAPERSTRK